MKLIDKIRTQITRENRNFCGIFVGKVGSGKSYSSIKICKVLDPSFNVDRIVFSVDDFIKLVTDGNLPAGSCILFDEAGIEISNRKSYMDKFNTKMANVLITWRSLNLILFVTTPMIKQLDAGVRKMFDAMFETKKILKGEKKVVTKVKFIIVDQQSGDAYYQNARRGHKILRVKIGMPDKELLDLYEAKKKAYQMKLYRSLVDNSITLNDNPNNKEIPVVDYNNIISKMDSSKWRK